MPLRHRIFLAIAILGVYAQILQAMLIREGLVVFYGNEGQLEYDFVVAPGVDPSIIQITFSGAEEITVDDAGNLTVSISSGEIVQPAPVIYQESDGSRTAVRGGYALSSDDLVGFGIGAYDETRPLVIDPMLSYSTFLGGTSVDNGHGIAVDPTGSIYVVGDTGSTNFPTESAIFPERDSSGDIFVSKLAPGGRT